MTQTEHTVTEVEQNETEQARGRLRAVMSVETAAVPRKRRSGHGGTFDWPLFQRRRLGFVA